MGPWKPTTFGAQYTEASSLEPAERGSMLILGIGLWAVVCALLAGTVALTLVALERRELLAKPIRSRLRCR